MLDLVRGSLSCEAKMLLPTFSLIGEVGMDVSAVKYISGTTCIENSIRRYFKSRECPNDTHFIVPDQTPLSKRHPAKPTSVVVGFIGMLIAASY